MRAPDRAGEREYISFLFKGGLGMIFDSISSLKEIRRLNPTAGNAGMERVIAGLNE